MPEDSARQVASEDGPCGASRLAFKLGSQLSPLRLQLQIAARRQLERPVVHQRPTNHARVQDYLPRIRAQMLPDSP